MDDIVRQVLGIARGIWKFRWLALIVTWVVALAGTAFVMRIPDQYEASARIYVDTQSILKPLMAGLTVQPNVEQQINMLSRTLMSRPNLEKLVRMADLDLKANTPAEQDRLIDGLTKAISIRNTGRDNLYTLNYREEDQEKAKRVIQSLVSIFVESSLGATRKDTDSAKTFLNEQIKQYEARLEEAEARVKEFRLRNIESQSVEGRDAAGRMAQAAVLLQQAQLQLKEAENARNAAKAQLEAERTQGTLFSTESLLSEPTIAVSTPEIDSRIAQHRHTLDGLRQRYTDQHPDVVSTLRLISDLEAAKVREMAERRKAALAAAKAPGQSQSSSLAAQELGRMVATAEVQVASLRARVGEYAARLAEAREALKTAPQLEAEAAQLNRDYGIIKKSYEDLVARRQSAVMSGELEVASGVADFRLIDPPRVSPRPVAPNRLLLIPGVLAAAFGAGLAAAFMLSQLRPTFDSPEDLRAKTGLPLLGVVSMVIDDQQRRRARAGMLRFASASGSLLALFAAGMILMALLNR